MYHLEVRDKVSGVLVQNISSDQPRFLVTDLPPSSWLSSGLNLTVYTATQVQYSTVQYSTVKYSEVQYSTVQQYSTTVQYNTVQYSTVQYSIVHINLTLYTATQGHGGQASLTSLGVGVDTGSRAAVAELQHEVGTRQPVQALEAVQTGCTQSTDKVHTKCTQSADKVHASY